MMRKFWNWLLDDEPIVELDGIEDPHDNADPQVKTYMFGGGMETGEWITHWEERA